METQVEYVVLPDWQRFSNPERREADVCPAGGCIPSSSRNKIPATAIQECHQRRNTRDGKGIAEQVCLR